MSRATKARVIVLTDDARLVPDVSDGRDVLVISLDSQATSELAGRAGLEVRAIVEYAPRPFASYDELYDHFKRDMRERLAPKDASGQSRFVFEMLWDDILQNLVHVHYIERLVEELRKREQPARFEFAISDGELDELFRRIVQRLP